MATIRHKTDRGALGEFPLSTALCSRSVANCATTKPQVNAEKWLQVYKPVYLINKEEKEKSGYGHVRRQARACACAREEDQMDNTRYDGVDDLPAFPPTCRRCERCTPAPWPHGAGRNSVGWCEVLEDWVEWLDERTDCGDYEEGGIGVTAPRWTDFRGLRVFVSGPMDGRPNFNREEFLRVDALLRRYGAAEVWDPALLADDLALDPLDGDQAERERLSDLAHQRAMRANLRELVRSDQNGPYYDAVVVLDGGGRFGGSWIESVVAEAVGVPVVRSGEVR